MKLSRYMNIIVIGIALLVFALCKSVTAIPKGWEEFTDGGFGHTAYWNGELIKSTGGSEHWFLTTRENWDEWGFATMLIHWDPQKQTGRIVDFTHYGYTFYFTNWSGKIVYNEATGEYNFDIRGPGRGYIDLEGDGNIKEGQVWGYYRGIWMPTDVDNPMQGAYSEADWGSTIRYHK